MIVFISSSTSLGSSPERSFSRRAEWEDFRESVLRGREIHSLTKGNSSLQGLLPGTDLGDVDVVEHTVDTGVDERSHDLGGHAETGSVEVNGERRGAHGVYWGCLSSSVRREPRLRRYRVDASLRFVS